MISVDFVTLDIPDPTAADAFYTTAFDLGDRVCARGSEAPTTGFRGFTLSPVVSQPVTVDLIGAAPDAGATSLKPREIRAKRPTGTRASASSRTGCRPDARPDARPTNCLAAY